MPVDNSPLSGATHDHVDNLVTTGPPPIALVGVAGTVTSSGVGVANSPPWGAGASRTAGNLLLCSMCGFAAATLPTPPAGWSTAAQFSGGICSASLFYKVATGGDAAPTVTGVSGASLTGQLLEFTRTGAAPLDQAGTGAAVTSPIVATAGSADAAAGDLLFTVGALKYSAANANSQTVTFNNGAPTTLIIVGASVNHYTAAYGVSTGNASPSSASFAFDLTNISGNGALALATFHV
jgi:hypothetical protein